MLGCMAKAITREITIDQNELEDAQWVSKDVLLKAYAGYDVGITPARPGTIAEFLIQNWVKGTLTHKK
jgi:NTP pyrophosphohydrolases containing a Zn-finger, probably nucleic-acid-binding